MLKSQIFRFGPLVLFLDQTLVTVFFSFLELLMVFTLLENLRTIIVIVLIVLSISLPTDIILPGKEKKGILTFKNLALMKDRH